MKTGVGDEVENRVCVWVRECVIDRNLVFLPCGWILDCVSRGLRNVNVPGTFCYYTLYCYSTCLAQERDTQEVRGLDTAQ